MLKFLREQGIEDISPQNQMVGTAQNDTGLAENKQGQQYLSVKAQSKNVRKSNIMVVVLFCMGLLCLWFMIAKCKPQAASATTSDAEEKQIETAIARLTGVRSEMFDRMDQVLNKFGEFSDVLQVRVNELVKNPFELELFLAGLSGKLDSDQQQNVDTELIRQQQLQQQLQQQAKSLRLCSIMLSGRQSILRSTTKDESDPRKCCMINDKILYEGDSIESFNIIRIGDSYVELQWQAEHQGQAEQSQGAKIVLKLSE